MKARAVVVEAIEFAELFVFSSELTVISSAESFTQNFVFSWAERVGEKVFVRKRIKPEQQLQTSSPSYQSPQMALSTCVLVLLSDAWFWISHSGFLELHFFFSRWAAGWKLLKCDRLFFVPASVGDSGTVHPIAFQILWSLHWNAKIFRTIRDQRKRNEVTSLGKLAN